MGTSACTQGCVASGDALIAQFRNWVDRASEQVWQAGSRNVAIHNAEGETMIDLPLLLVILLAIVKPHLVLLGAVVLLAAHGSIAVEQVRQ